MIAASLMAVLAMATSPVVAFEGKTPQEVTSSLAALCMERQFPVIDLGPNQVKCEVSMTNEQKGHLLFTKFFQRRYTNDVRWFIQFTVVPSGEGSVAQHRQWIEAQINGGTRSADIDEPTTNARATASLVQLGGVVR